MSTPPRKLEVTDTNGNRLPFSDAIEEAMDEYVTEGQGSEWFDEVVAKISEMHLNLILYGKTNL